MRAARLAMLYFAIVFGVGFVLGVFRVLVLLPRMGERSAELLEAPFMLLAMLLTARWLVSRFPCTSLEHANVGLLAMGLVLLADLGVGLGMRGMTLAEVFLDRDPVAGAVYYALLCIFAALPWLTGRRKDAA